MFLNLVTRSLKMAEKRSNICRWYYSHPTDYFKNNHLLVVVELQCCAETWKSTQVKHYYPLLTSPWLL